MNLHHEVEEGNLSLATPLWIADMVRRTTVVTARQVGGFKRIATPTLEQVAWFGRHRAAARELIERGRAVSQQIAIIAAVAKRAGEVLPQAARIYHSKPGRELSGLVQLLQQEEENYRRFVLGPVSNLRGWWGAWKGAARAARPTLLFFLWLQKVRGVPEWIDRTELPPWEKAKWLLLFIAYEEEGSPKAGWAYRRLLQITDDYFGLRDQGLAKAYPKSPHPVLYKIDPHNPGSKRFFDFWGMADEFWASQSVSIRNTSPFAVYKIFQRGELDFLLREFLYDVKDAIKTPLRRGEFDRVFAPEDLERRERREEEDVLVRSFEKGMKRAIKDSWKKTTGGKIWIPREEPHSPKLAQARRDFREYFASRTSIATAVDWEKLEKEYWRRVRDLRPKYKQILEFYASHPTAHPREVAKETGTSLRTVFRAKAKEREIWRTLIEERREIL